MLNKLFCVILLASLLLTGCAEKSIDTVPGNTHVPKASPPAIPDYQIDPVDVVSPDRPSSEFEAIEGQLIALADTQEAAEEIAELYQIQLLTYSYGVALYYTEEDTDDVIARGVSNGWPTLSKNHVSHAYSS